MIQPLPSRHTPFFLALCSFFLLCIVAGFLHFQQFQTLQRIHQEAAKVRGHTLASDTSRKIAHALSLGIPLHELVGVDALLHSLRQQHPDLISIEIQDTQSRPLWASASAQSNGAVHASSVISGPNKATTAIVHAYVHPQQAGQLLAQKFWVWLGLLALLTALSYWVARLCFSLHPWLRQDVINRISDDVRRGIFQFAWISSHSVLHDIRPEQLSAGVRAVHESKERLQRLVHSLRQTEPSPHHRQQLDAILQKATHSLTLSEKLERRRIHAIEHQCFWMSLLLALASTSPWIWQVMVVHDHAAVPFPATTLYFASMLLMYCLAKYIKLPVMQILITGFIIMLFAPFVLPRNSTGTAAQAVISGLLTGFSYHAFQSVIYAARRKFIFARPRLSRPVERAYLYVLVCFGPLLALLSKQALSDDFARIALQLPAACGLMTCLLWNVNVSPWRTRMRPLSVVTSTKSIWSTRCFYAAVGLCIGTYSADASTFSVQWAILLMAGWCTGCFFLTRTHDPTRLGFTLVLLSLSVWCLVRPSDLAMAIVSYSMAALGAIAPAKHRARREFSFIWVGLFIGLCTNYLYSPTIALPLSAMLMGCSCLLSLKYSRQGDVRAH